MFAAMAQSDASALALTLILGVIGLVVLWCFYMVTFRTEDWMKLMRADQERRKLAQQEREAEEARKAKRDERVGKTFGTLASLAKLFIK
jgi:amino acid permease